jgi:hypothetical protein
MDVSSVSIIAHRSIIKDYLFPFRYFLSFSDKVRHGRVQAGGESTINQIQGPIWVHQAPDLIINYSLVIYVPHTGHFMSKHGFPRS